MKQTYCVTDKAFNQISIPILLIWDIEIRVIIVVRKQNLDRPKIHCTGRVGSFAFDLGFTTV